MEEDDDCWLKEWTEEPESIKQETDNYVQDVMEKNSCNESSSCGLDETGKTKSKFPRKYSQRVTSKRVNSLIEKACHGAPESKKPINLCQFKCIHCDKILSNFFSTRTHCVRHHGGKIISIEDVEKYIESVVSHVCLICSSKTLCDTAFIKRHVQAHGYTVSQYVQKFKLDTSKEPAGTIYSEKVIGNLCVYLCKNCDREFTCRDNFITHQVNRECSFNAHSEMVKRVFHRCQLCGKSVQCEKRLLKGHFQNVHNIDLNEYCRKTRCTIDESSSKHFSRVFLKSLLVSKKVDNLCIFKCDKCNKKFYASNRYYEHIYMHHKKLSPSLFPSFHSGYSYKCKSCDTLMLCDKRVISAHMRKVHKS